MENQEVFNPKDILTFIETINSLKHTARKGWLVHNVSQPETISGHMYTMAMMTFFLADDNPSEKPSLNRFKCLQMTLVHDLAECIVGDITPHDNIPEDEKHRMEDEAMKKLIKLLPSKVGDLIYKLYKEYEAKETPEAKFVKELDRFDMIFTARGYEKRDGSHGKLEEFFASAKGKFEHPMVKELANEMETQRECDITKMIKK